MQLYLNRFADSPGPYRWIYIPKICLPSRENSFFGLVGLSVLAAAQESASTLSFAFLSGLWLPFRPFQGGALGRLGLGGDNVSTNKLYKPGSADLVRYVVIRCNHLGNMSQIRNSAVWTMLRTRHSTGTYRSRSHAHFSSDSFSDQESNRFFQEHTR